MKDILIIFCVLLVVLLVISTLGGSIRPAADEPAARPPVFPTTLKTVQHYTDDAAVPPAELPTQQEQPTTISQFTNDSAASPAVPDGFDNGDSFASF